ncbi:hypothetical protein PMAYCL1PPCAC_12772 [Pristionchus mayeri]|uniref:Uncharacterized protein n=1 Tax=Pristionchus mayeri TaxID=1317129 RepID=A0AAN4ZJS1_9BILA|nr:hypothetical protein PMAYCL1PPCAC_12772 [Pristionchus mayeri]
MPTISSPSSLLSSKSDSFHCPPLLLSFLLLPPLSPFHNLQWRIGIEKNCRRARVFLLGVAHFPPSPMHLADLKRAVEDVLLQPEVNDVTKREGRSSIAALDLCQMTPSTSSSASCASSSSGCPSVATRTCSSSSETVAAGGGNLATSTSLDHIMLRGTSSISRSGGISRRSSRILPHHTHSHLPASKRKRSNSLSSSGYYKPQSGLPPPSSLPPTARATPFREDSYHPPHKLSLGSSESTDSSAPPEYSFVAPPSGSLFLSSPPLPIEAPSAPESTLLTTGGSITNGFHEDEEMECD